ncbi:MAG: LacI family DNA-binding transcriptional regulator [Casimicrobiaceae bacterium]
MKRSTASDVAAAARVSTMTVSNVLNGRFDMMSGQTRKRVEDAIATLHYRPHAAGRSLRMNERLTIGALIVDESPTFLADPFITNLLAGLSNFLSGAGYGLLVQATAPQEVRNAVFMRRFATDGLCVLLSGSAQECRERTTQLLTLGQPLVLFESRHIRKVEADICFIRQDNHGGARTLAQHVLDRGARRLLFLVPRLAWPAIAERRRGVEAALRKVSGAHLTVIACGEEFGETRAALAAHLDQHEMPDAILGGNDQMGIAAMRLLADRGLRVPEDVLVSGFNAFQFRLYTEPMLTSVISSAYDMGARAGSELLHRLTAGVFANAEVVLPTRFAPGGSTSRESPPVPIQTSTRRPG